jgi:hypothetical protein
VAPTTASSEPRSKLPPEQKRQLATLGSLGASLASDTIDTERECIGLKGGSSFFASDNERRCVDNAAREFTSTFGVGEDVIRLLARSMRGPCRVRLLAYLGAGGTGDRLQAAIQSAGRHASRGEAKAFDTAVKELVDPALKENNDALLAARRDC